MENITNEMVQLFIQKNFKHAEGWLEDWKQFKASYQVKRNWEIVSVICEKFGNEIRQVNTFEYLRGGYDKSSHGWKIHSVRRLSEPEEIFTIGEKIKYKDGGATGTIAGFRIFEKDILVDASVSLIKGFQYSISYIEKVKDPKITWAVHTKLKNLEHCWIARGYEEDEVIQNDKTVHTFETKEQAEEFIRLEQPKYSLVFILDSLCNETVNLVDRYNLRKIIEAYEAKQQSQ